MNNSNLKNPSTQIHEKIAYFQNRVQHYLEQILPTDLHPQHLHDAMRYSVLGNGKRLRPNLVYFIATMLGAVLDETLDRPAAAVELIHCFSLVHDDLPAMDNDDFRRGRPTCHKAFDEATAILVGDALQSLAFELLSDSHFKNPALALKMVRILAQASGSQGLAGGQAIDLQSQGQLLHLPELELMHIRKTGALIMASIRLGAFAAGNQDDTLHKQLTQLGYDLGLIFQITDDILNVEGDAKLLGKQVGSDRERAKATYASIMGIQKAKGQIQFLQERILKTLAELPYNTEALRQFSETIIHRNF